MKPKHLFVIAFILICATGALLIIAAKNQNVHLSDLEKMVAQDIMEDFESSSNGDIVTFYKHGVTTYGTVEVSSASKHILVKGYRLSPELNEVWFHKSRIVSISKPEPQGLH